MDLNKRYTEVSDKTANNLRSVAQSMTIGDLSRLSLPEIDSTISQVAQLIPAGNVTGLILSGLSRLPGRRLPQTVARRDIDLLLKGVEQTFDTAIYSAFFAGPAAVIGGYQKLLKLTGKEPEDAFPEGLWQFYTEYALREDTARHANETHGFDTYLKQHHLSLNKVDRMTAWLMAAIQCLHQYEALLTNEWRERICTHLLVELVKNEADGPAYVQLYRKWQKQLPYGRGEDAPAGESYPAYRRRKFDQFLAETFRNLPGQLRRHWAEQVEEVESRELPAYLRQMSILAHLNPGPYSETRVALPLEQLHVGLIYGGNYYLIPACTPGSNRPAELQTVRAQVAGVVDTPMGPGEGLARLADIRRTAWPGLRRKLNETLVKKLEQVRLAPIWLNGDAQPRHAPLAELRRVERGLGDHALTLFDTAETFVFDQSHIFFDGAWGAALAEIMTQEALSWVQPLKDTPQPRPVRLAPLTFEFRPADLALIQQAPRVTPEVSAETDRVDLKAMLRLRRLFKQRNDLLQLTINDLLILYRAIHAATYRPDPELLDELKKLAQEGQSRAALSALEALDQTKQLNPTIVIPVDVSPRSPRDRLQPITFEAPLKDLGLLELHQQVVAAWLAYRKDAAGDRGAAYVEFDQLQRTYLATLAGFGQVLGKVKEMALAGESGSMGALKLLAHIPAPLRQLLDKVPERFEVLNDLIKGREAFSNIGAVAPASSLTRFISAKDDNERKTLVWGVITDAQGVMRLSLRDFRPHVGLLAAAGQKALAGRITQHYLDSYAAGLNTFVRELQWITQASRETRLK